MNRLFRISLRWPCRPLSFLMLIATFCFGTPLQAAVPSQPGVDAPELAALGGFGVGYRVIELAAPAGGGPSALGRNVTVDLWYPARVAAADKREDYHGTLSSEPPLPRAAFSITALAVRNAPALAGPFPLVVVSHGYGNDTVAFSWLGENLASKGYVVAAVRHLDPEYSDRSRFAAVVLRRPLDIVFVARSLQTLDSTRQLIDPTRTALFGYSMGGFGVLSAGGATLDPASPMVASVPEGALAAYARGGALRESLRVPGLRAIVALAPAGGDAKAWGDPKGGNATGIADIDVPLFLVAGDQDRTVNYQTGARAFFEAAVHAPRFLLTYKEGGHAIGMAPIPPEMRGRLWDLDWFADPVWRNERVVAINLHFVTAFFDTYVKGDASRAAYLEVPGEESDAGRWPGKPKDAAYDAFSPGAGSDAGSGTAAITLWKGFRDRHAAGLRLERRPATPP